MAIEVKEILIKTSVDSKSESNGDKALCEDIKQVKNEIVKECMENVIEYLNRMEER